MSGRARVATAIVVVSCVASGGSAVAQAGETLGEVRVHGNHTTPDEDVVALAGLHVGAAVTDAEIDRAAERLRGSGRFADVEVRKRYRSIDNPADILVILLVDEHPATTAGDLMPGPLKRIRSLGMWLPIVDYADGYGLTYGARVSFVDTLGPRSRISVPLTWGGERQAAVEADRVLSRGPFSRVQGALSITRRENPHFALADRREQVRVRAERAFAAWLRVGGGVRATHVRFGGVEQRHVAPDLDVVVDTRIDPVFPRNAVHATSGVEQLRFDAGPNVTRWTADARGYLGLVRSSVLAVRAVSIRATDALPRYEQALLGGTSMLRGYRFGYRAGDSLAALSAEVLVPVTSPLGWGRFGVKGFVDAGTVYGASDRLRGQRFDRGVGAGVFVTAPVVRAGLDVAWPRHGAGGPRWHFSLGASF